MTDLSPQTFDTPDHWTLVVSVPAGDLTVTTHDAPVTELQITGVREPEDIVVRADERAREISITQNKRGRFNWRGSSINVAVSAPLGTDVRVKGASLDVAVHGRVGNLNVDTASGDLRADHVDGILRTHSASGDLSVDHVSGALSVQCVSGDVEVGRADRDVTIQSVSGDVTIERLSSGRTSVHSVSGDVDLGVARGLQLHLDLSSLSGSARTELDVDGDTGGMAPPASVALDINARTVSGDIRVRRSLTADV
jgi:DUF4097 and DUF4098 domain-containing protein YvlB